MPHLDDLPRHGWIACRKCLSPSETELRTGAWKVVNDPAAWGSSRPSVLVLGFSKGFTQSDAGRSGRFEDVPFKGMRPRLSETLSALGVLNRGEDVTDRVAATETELAFGSLVRCSLSRFNPKKQRLECTGAIMPKAFNEEVAPLVRNCGETFLRRLPESLKLIVMLGTGDAYIAGCRALVQQLHSKSFAIVNDVAYRAGGVLWVHASHPSGLNGHHTSWMEGSPTDKQGRKRLLAQSAIGSVALSAA